MRLYIKKIGKNSMVVYKESLTDSLISDLATASVWCLLILSDALFSIYIGRSYIIDFMVVALFMMHTFSSINSKKEESTKEEIEDILNLKK